MWTVTLLALLVQIILSWRQRPINPPAEDLSELDKLRVTVTVPVYNEDQHILDRTLYSLFHQSRLPEHVSVIDDGSIVDYTDLRTFWEHHKPPSVELSWHRQVNRGKRHAQATAFRDDPLADIFVTIDSDSALEARAISEGLKPFVDSRVQSVAGLEMALNFRRNLLTRAMAARSLAFQLSAMAAQSSAGGQVLINPGAFSLYRGDLIRYILPAYVSETWCGQPITLGDDTALTLFAACAGRAVHQPSAVSFPVYPEMLSHHLRQWTRWMRASTLRTFWRLRYLPIGSYGFFFVLFSIWSFFASVAFSILIPLTWPASLSLLVGGGVALLLWPWAIAIRMFNVRRSDESRWQRLLGLALLPAAAFWYLLILRQIRFYGIATCARQAWITRQQIEVAFSDIVKPWPCRELSRPS